MTNVTMEVIVRPFAPVVVTPPALAARATGGTDDPIAFSLGGKGGRTLSITLDKNKIVVKPEDKNDLKESGRQSTKVRVENENDPEQFVEFCRADKISMRPKKDQPNGQPNEQASYAKSVNDTQAAFAASQIAPNKPEVHSFGYKYPSDKTCKSPSAPPKGCSDGH